MLLRLDSTTGAVKAIWNTGQGAGVETNNTPVNTLHVAGDNLYVGGQFAQFGGETRFGLALLASPDAPIMGREADGRITVFRNAEDGSETTHFRVTGVSGGNLFLNDGTTPLPTGAFIKVAEGELGLRFTSTSGGGGGVTLVSAVNETAAGAGTAATTLDLSQARPPVIRFENAAYRVNEGQGTLDLFGKTRILRAV